MRVKNICNLGWLDYPDLPLGAGVEHEVPERVGKLLIARRHAVEVELPPKTAEAAKPAEPVVAKLVPSQPTAKLNQHKPKEK